MAIKRFVVPLTTDEDGAATAYTPVFSGKIDTIRYVKTDFADGVDLTITAEGTGESILAKEDVNASVTYAPRQPTHSAAGAAALYASGGAAVNDKIVLAADRVKIVVGSGGATKTGAVHVTVE